MADSAPQRATDALLQHFRRQRPLRGGSLIVTIFGDAIAPRGGAISLGSLIRLAQPFGLTERLVRTSVARLAADDWLKAQREGRLSYYQLTKKGRGRFADATQRIYAENPQSWDGHWTLIVLPQGSRQRREDVRDELKWLGFGQLAPGILAHPARAPQDTRERLRELKLLNDVILMEATADGSADNSHLALAGWDLAELSSGYRRFIAMFEKPKKSVANVHALEPETAFIIRTLLIHEYRKIHLRDPLLPRSLLPADWVGARAYELCRTLYAKVFGAAEEFLTATVATRNGGLPAAARSTFKRFGGLSGRP